MRFASDPICAVVAASSANQMLRELRAAARVAATCELRLDWLANAAETERLIAELPSALAEIRADANRAPGKLCIIATLRRRDAGGRFRGTRAEQWKFLKAAVAAGCSRCDIELQSAEKLSAAQRVNLRAAGARLLISFHDFRRTPRDLAAVVARLDRCHGDAIKVATECRKFSDAARILAIARGRTDVIAIPMGEAGLTGRILGLRLRSALAYGSLAQSTAPGQLSIREMRDVYHADQLDRRTRIFAVIGDPVAHSLSPAIHAAGYRARGHNAIFLAIRVENLRDFIAAIPSFAISGLAVTLPHKQAMLRHLDECDPHAAKIGAVNTVVVKADGRLVGYNTDYVGVVRAVEPHLRLRGSRALIFGAGGAARAAAFALADAGANVSICSRRPEQAGSLAKHSGAVNIPRAALKHSTFDLVINATPVGMREKDSSPLRESELNCEFVMDMIYNPLDTPLLKLASQRGLKTISGLDMFIAQAAEQWTRWWSSEAPVEEMRGAVIAALNPAKETEHAADAAAAVARSH